MYDKDPTSFISLLSGLMLHAAALHDEDIVLSYAESENTSMEGASDDEHSSAGAERDIDDVEPNDVDVVEECSC